MAAKKINRTPQEEELYQKRLRAAAKAREVLAANRAAKKAAAAEQGAPSTRRKRVPRKTQIGDIVEVVEVAEVFPIGKGPGGRRSMVLLEADAVVNGGRDQQYGQPEDNFALIGKLWSDYLGTEIKAHDVAALMMLLKVARVKTAPDKQDHWVDIAGYAACGFDCVS